MYLYKYFIIFGSRFLYLFELKNFRWPVFCVYNCFHRFPFKFTSIWLFNFVYIYLVDSGAIANGLNPLTISQIAIACSWKAIGMTNNIANTKEMSNVAKTEAIKIAKALRRPQMDNHRGMSFDLYNTE